VRNVAVSAPALYEALSRVVGTAHVLTDAGALAAAAVDGATPRWVARPRSVEEVSGVLALASAERLAVTPRGSGSSVGMGRPPRSLDLVLDLSRLTAIVDYVPEDMVASVEAGLTFDALSARLEPRRQRLALDVIGGGARTIGGVLATGASGPLRYRYGTGRDLLLGVRFVQADGTVTWGGSRVVKSVTGYDVPKLLVGSLGTLGVIVGATLRLHPMPIATGSWLCSFDSAAAADRFLAELLASSLEPERLVLQNAAARRRCGRAGAGLAVLVSVGSAEEAVESQGAALGAMASRHGGAFEAMPESAWSGLAPALDAPVVLALAGEVRRIVAWLGRAEALAARAGLELSAVGQAGNGVLHLALAGPRSARESIAQGLLAPLRQELAGEGGGVVVERAPAPLKAGLDVWGPIAPELQAIFERIKREFDPHGILNPGRFVGGL